MTDPFPYQEIPHEKLSEIAVNLARERDRLAGQVAVYRERYGPLDRTIITENRIVASGGGVIMRSGEWTSQPVEISGTPFCEDHKPLLVNFGSEDFDHLVEKRRAAEGADMPHPDERANDQRWPLAMCVVVIVVLSAAGWMAVPWLWSGVVWAWGVVT